jgi:hypothetical protein
MVPVIAPEEMAQDLGISPTNESYQICLRRCWTTLKILFSTRRIPVAFRRVITLSFISIRVINNARNEVRNESSEKGRVSNVE